MAEFTLKLEIEFTPGVWTDLSQWADWSAGFSLHVGRNTQFEAVAPSTFDCTLINTDGRFTPQRQTLRDGTPHPYWPNVSPRRRVRFSWVISGAPYPQFTGEIKALTPSYKDGWQPRVSLSAVDVLARLSRVTMLSPLDQEIVPDPVRYRWPMTDDGSSNAAVEVGGGPSLTPYGSTAPVVQWGQDGPGSANGPAVLFAPVPTVQDSGQLLGASGLDVQTQAGFSVELWANFAASPYQETLLVLDNRIQLDAAGAFSLMIRTGSSLLVVARHTISESSTSFATASSPTPSLGDWHHIVVTYTAAGTLTLYVDTVTGVVVPAAGSVVPPVYKRIQVGGYYADGFNDGLINFPGRLGQVSIYDGALSAARVSRHYNGGNAWLNETPDERIGRYLGYGAVAASDLDLDASTVALSTYDQAGKDLLAASSDAVTSEGGGSALWVNGAGTARFANRDNRLTGPPVLVLDAYADLDVEDWQPQFSAETLVNQVTGQRATASNSAASTQIVTDNDSINDYGPAGESFSSWARRDQDVLSNAQQRLASRSQPAVRVPQVPVDVFTGCVGVQDDGTPDLVRIAQLDLGDRIRIENLDATSGLPASSLDAFAEGWTDSGTDSTYRRVIDASAAVQTTGRYAAAAGVTTDMARYQCDGQTLAAGITAAATTLVIATPGGFPVMTSAAAAYPLNITVGTEQITLTGPPDQAVSPQTYTGVARGVAGTQPAAQASGAGVDLAPVVTYAL